MSSAFVPLDTLFMSKVIQDNTAEDGSEKDPRLLARFDNPICRRCHEDFKRKYPNQPFGIKCEGIYNEEDYALKKAQFESGNPGETIEIDEIREIYDVVFWAERYIVAVDDYGNVQPFRSRWYQTEVLRCTARHKVDRMGRGLGKTLTGVVEELHKAICNKKMEILVVCPVDSQTQLWYDTIKFQLENSPYLRGSLAGSRQAPYKVFNFENGSKVSLFTAGSKSGRGADSVRGQNPRRTRLDEQDYLAPKDYQAIMPLVRRYANSEFHGASTPTGRREMFWEMCVRNPEYREFYFPASVHPDWSPAKEASCMKEARTMDRYRHEFLAEFGDPTDGVFKGIHIDNCKSTVYRGGPYTYRNIRRDPSCDYFMGVDWNGRGTGTKIRVVEYNPVTKVRYMVDKRTVDEPGATQQMSMRAIRDMNRKWVCEAIYIDSGYGNGQDEMIRLMGTSPEDPADSRLMEVKSIDFGATMEFNKLVLPGAGKTRFPNANDDSKFERRTKCFMVDGMVMAVESGLFEFSAMPNEDELLEEQLRAYRVKTYSSHGFANTYEAGDAADHDLDATMLAMLACEIKHGIFHTEDTVRRMAKVLHVAGWSGSSGTSDSREVLKGATGVPSRSPATNSNQDRWRVQYYLRNGAIVVPNNRLSSNSPGRGSRTAAFRNPPTSRGPWRRPF